MLRFSRLSIDFNRFQSISDCPITVKKKRLFCVHFDVANVCNEIFAIYIVDVRVFDCVLYILCRANGLH